ncbi:MAG: carbamoyl-phosphate synthase large subunit [Planctomycetes bacterium]|nr:carbamoyl-phosphate synthase large subunit [Planctomycetota bacterium]
MPKRTDIKKVLIIGSGPIVIGQACEFDYSGSQACKALREEGYQVVLINSNPATIMTDPLMADRTYIEPITAEVIEKIIVREKPDAVLPTVGGQTGLNMAVFLARAGVFKKYGVEVLGASAKAIARAEDRDLFKRAMLEIGIQVPESGIATSVDEGMEIGQRIGLPLILRPAFTLGGSGGATAYNLEELKAGLVRALTTSPIGQVLVEQSVLGWKEIEFEVMRDSADNVIIITSMENVDPMGVHTGDSMVVAPSQTLSAPEYVHYTNLCRRIIRKIDITGGGCNIQFAGNPDNGHVVIIEVNPRLSRSSALASKATGFPIARVATKLAIGMTLPEVLNDVTGKTHAFFEPTVDYCVFKIARFTFKKFPQADPTLNTSMKSVGEAMSIGRTFKEALQKGIRSLEISRYGLGFDGRDDLVPEPADDVELAHKLVVPNDKRHFYVKYALQKGWSAQKLADLTKIDRWFIENIREILEVARKVAAYHGPDGLASMPDDLLREAKRAGFSDVQIGHLTGAGELAAYAARQARGLRPSYKLVDTCAGEFSADRPYYYSTYEPVDENRITDRRKILILGGGPNRIGQGIEFDYCCCHASYAVKELGYEAIIVNSNPETVSTDYDTSDKLYFEPLTREDVLAIVNAEKPEGVIVQLGGQTPLNLAVPLEQAGVRILGTSPDSIDRAENRERFKQLLDQFGLHQPPNGTATSLEGARAIAAEIGYPVVIRPSYVLGGTAMEIVYDEEDLARFMVEAKIASDTFGDHPILIDKFIDNAIEVDVDAVADGKTCVIGGILEHIEPAGVHSGDAAMVLPPITLTVQMVARLTEYTKALATALQVKGLMNVQYAVRGDTIYVFEVNPRASRTVPFVSKAIGVPLANIATKVMLGYTLEQLGFTKEVVPEHFAVKQSVFPFVRFPGVDAVLGPEMKSTGEVMGIDSSFGIACAKGLQGAGHALPMEGTVFISVRNADKRDIIFIAKKLEDLGFDLLATEGTAAALAHNDVKVRCLQRISIGRPNILDMIKNKEVRLIINTVSGKTPRKDEVTIRTQAIARGIPLISTVSAAAAFVNGIEALRKRGLSVKSLQEFGQHYTPPKTLPKPPGRARRGIDAGPRSR